MTETSDARVGKHTSRASRAPSACVDEGDASLSQHVDDVREEDEAHDGKKHQS